MYKKRCKQIGREPLDYKTYRKLIGALLAELNRKMINERFIFVVPYKLGAHYVRSHKPDNRNENPIDWGNTQAVGKTVIHVNNHTFGYFHKLYWNIKKAVFKHKKYYSWKAYQSRKAGKELGIGKYGLAYKIKETSTDPYQESFFKV